jgi:hypothetical protein
LKSRGSCPSPRQLDEDPAIPALDTSKRTAALEFFERNFAKIRYYLTNILKSEQFTPEEIKKSQKSFDSLIGWFGPEERPPTVLSMVYEKPEEKVETDWRSKFKNGTTIEKVDYFWHKLVKKIDNYPAKSHRRSTSDAFRFSSSNIGNAGASASGPTSNPASRMQSPNRKQFCEPVDSSVFLLKALTSESKAPRKSTEPPSTNRFLLTSQKLELKPLVSASRRSLHQTGTLQSLVPMTRNHKVLFEKKDTKVEELSPQQSKKDFIRSASLLTGNKHMKFSTAATTRVTSIAPTPGRAYNVFDVRPGNSKVDFQVSAGGMKKLKAEMEGMDRDRDLTKTETHDFKIKHQKSYRRQLTHSLAVSDAKAFKTTDEPTELLRFEDSHPGLGKQARCSESSTKLIGSSKFIDSGKGLNSLAAHAPHSN